MSNDNLEIVHDFNYPRLPIIQRGMTSKAYIKKHCVQIKTVIQK